MLGAANAPGRRGRPRCAPRPTRPRVVEVVARCRARRTPAARTTAATTHEHQRARAAIAAPVAEDHSQASRRRPVERRSDRDDVEQHPVGEEVPGLLRAARPPASATSPTSSPKPSRTCAWISGSRGRVALHLEQQRVPVGQQLSSYAWPIAFSRSLSGAAAAASAERPRRPARRQRSDAGEEQLLLGAEQPEQVRLRDAGLARDRLGRGAVVAALGEVPQRDREDLLAALLGGLADGPMAMPRC